jgi:acetyl-CoA carboxylase carboxyl transferase subunit alpha
MDNDFAFRVEPGVFLLKQKLLNLQSKKYKTIGGKNQRLKKSYCLLKVKLLTLKKKLQIQKKRSFLNLNTLKSLSLVRDCSRRHSIDYINNVFECFEELHGDNLKGDDPSIVCGFGLLKGNSVCIIAQEKGRSLKTKISRSFGCPKPSGYRKALRTMLKAEVLGTPIVTIVDTPGAFPGIESEENNISGAISLNIREFFFIKVPIVTVIIGEGGSGGALGIGISDKIIMLEHSYFSVISPEGCSSIL